LCAANPSNSITYESDNTTPYPDTVVVDPEQESATVRSDGCITTSGQKGECALFSECYPTLFSAIPGSEDKYSLVENQVLAEMLVNASGTCNEDSIGNIIA